MLCLNCGADDEVIDSRQRQGYVMRRRRCKHCKQRVTTMEVLASDIIEYQGKSAVLEILMTEVNDANVRRRSQNPSRNRGGVSSDDYLIKGEEDLDTKEDQWRRI